MDTKALEKFAQAARRQLHEQVAARLDRVLAADSAELRARARTIEELKARIKAGSKRAVVEQVAYTWFNRFCALRYMDVNRYTRLGVVSPAASPTGEAYTQPEILQEAKQGHIDERMHRAADVRDILGLLQGRLPSSDPQQEAYRRLLVGACNAYHDAMPFMFEKIDDYTELLMPGDLLSQNSILQGVREALNEGNCRDVEVIGWLYQFYIAEKKDAVMARQGAVHSEDIPAVTQLFTPHWIVRYMVENSLGRLWMLNHPNSRLVERMEYYIQPQTFEVSETSKVLRVTSPEEIRFCDPAAGSGHILTYAFDLLYAIYEEQGYNPVDIPRLILEKNLTGIEIDPRAGALAGFALMMKARAKDRHFFQRAAGDAGLRPNICIMEDVAFDTDELDAYVDRVGSDLFTQNVREWLQQFEQATTFGSLIRPLVTDTATIRERLDASGVFHDLFLSHTHDKLRAVLRMTEALCPRYHVVTANPPYMGSGNMNVVLKDFAQDRYPNSKPDLCTMFIERNLELVIPGGYVGMITMQSWMFLSSFEKLRAEILQKQTIETMSHLGPRAFDTIGGEVVSTTAFTLRRQTNTDYQGQYLRLVDGSSEAEKARMLRDALTTDNRQLITYRASAADFQKIPGAPVAYWVSDRVLDIFDTSSSIGDVAHPMQGSTIGNNARFLRFWYELSFSSQKEWRRAVKGGPYRKWYGNSLYMINWSDDGQEIKATGRATIRNSQFLFRPGIEWSRISSAKTSFRLLEQGFFFESASGVAFPSDDLRILLLSFLNTKLTEYFLALINPTLTFQSGDIARIPYIRKDVSTCGTKLVDMAKTDWESAEISWDFTNFLPLRQEFRCTTLYATYTILRARWYEMTQEMQRLEEENNRLFIDAYGLQDELDPDVPLREITLTCNPHHRYGRARLDRRRWEAFGQQFPQTAQQIAAIAAEMAPGMPETERLGLEQRLLEDTMRELISYAVGCMFGRYSLDKPGLILADSSQWSVDSDQLTVARMPVADNVIPILDGDWFAGDIAERFKQFLRVAFGEAHYEENLAFVEAALGRDVRGYFLRDFYPDHCRRYSNRPIYWLFSSARGSFNALIYLHRYRPDTASVVLNDYLREYRARLAARRAHLEGVSISAAAAPRDRAAALNEMEQIDRVLNELRDYEDKVLYPLAARQVEIDLDDGVLVNYNKLGKALKHVPGLSAKQA